MIYYANDCVDCGLPCTHEACPYYKVKHFMCDVCGAEDVTLYRYNFEELCEDCLLKNFDIVKGSNL